MLWHCKQCNRENCLKSFKLNFRFFIEQFCDHLPLDNERKVEKILHACEKRELFEPGYCVIYV